MTSRRSVILGGLALPLFATAARGAASPTPSMGLKSITASIAPIAPAERRARVAKLQALMVAQKVGALLVESGTTLEYFTGIRWFRSERTTAAVIPAQGGVVIVTPMFEEPSVRETLQVDGDVRIWNENENPFEVVVQGLTDRHVVSGPVAVESTTRFFIIDGIRRVSAAIDIVSGDTLVRACRLIKSPAELTLLQAANSVTIEALRYVHAHLELEMSSQEVLALMNKATAALGGEPEFSLVLLNEASAFPHGSKVPQTVRDGSVVLMDCGCEVHGYHSDISRTWVYGKASARQTKVWNTVKRGQELALETAKLGVPVGKVDDVVRAFYESEGWGPGYKRPGLPHRTGHGIGMDGHEPPFLVHGDATPLEAGMCFSDEPGIYIPGEFGIRLEDCWYMTSTGPKLFTPLAKSIEDPI